MLNAVFPARPRGPRQGSLVQLPKEGTDRETQIWLVEHAAEDTDIAMDSSGVLRHRGSPKLPSVIFSCMAIPRTWPLSQCSLASVSHVADQDVAGVQRASG